jgi:AbrB family looped-hinge helix DNA binding protein
MSKVTSKLQVTIPKAIAVKYGIRPGDDVRWEELPRGVVMVRVARDVKGGEGQVAEHGAYPALRRGGRRAARGLSRAERLAVFDAQMRRITHPEEEAREMERIRALRRKAEKERGWSREDLYEDRGFPR